MDASEELVQEAFQACYTSDSVIPPDYLWRALLTLSGDKVGPTYAVAEATPEGFSWAVYSVAHNGLIVVRATGPAAQTARRSDRDRDLIPKSLAAELYPFAAVTDFRVKSTQTLRRIGSDGARWWAKFEFVLDGQWRTLPDPKDEQQPWLRERAESVALALRDHIGL